MKSSKRFYAAYMLCAGVMVLGCTSSTTGKEGNLKFSYSTDDDFANFNKPIAVGAKLDLRVSKAGTEGNRDATVQSATTGDDAVLKVSSTSGNTVVLEAVGKGSSEITVEAKLAATGEVVSDAVDMMARVPEKHDIWHACLARTEREAYYLVSQDIYIFHEMKMNDGQDVIGYGYWPVKTDVEGALTLKTGHKDQQFLQFTTAAEPATVKVTSDLDGTVATVNLVKIDQANGAKLGEFDNRVVVNRTELGYVLPTIDDKPICQARAEFTIDNSSPDVCTVSKLTNVSETQQKRQAGWISIKGNAVGDCKFTVNYPGGDGGNGLSEELTVPVENQ